jgi:hypothetical protein
MSMPKEVKRLSQEADELHKQLFGGKNAEGESADGEEQNTQETDKEAPQKANSVQQDVQVQQTNSVPKSNATDDQSQVNPDDDPNSETWQQRYRSLQGIHNSKLSKADATIAAMQKQIDELKSSVDTGKPPEQVNSTRLLKDDEIEDYGEDLISVIKRAAREELRDEINTLRAENTQLKDMLGGVNSKVSNTAKRDLYSELGQAVPNWRELNHSEDFILWLGQPDLYSGAIRQDLLTQAFENDDIERVINFFKGFINETGAVQPQQEPRSNTRKPAVDMADMVAPGKPRQDSAVAQTGTHRDERVWTQNDIQSFYTAVRKGKFRANPQQKAQIEADIVRAANEGRVR